MKKNTKALSIVMTATVIAGTVTGCGKAQVSTAPTPGYETATETYCDTEAAYAPECESPLASAKGSNLFDGFTGSSASESSYTYLCDDEIILVPEYNTESYDKPDENGFFLSVGQPLSTFAADVDTASYANVRRMIENGYDAYSITPAAVRPEEFINYFSYDLNDPDRGEKFGVTTEISTCPWNKDHELMFVGVKAEDKLDGEIPKSNLVFLIDVSGSMQDQNKLPLLKEAFKDLVDNLPEDGTVSIVTYASQEKVLLSGESMANKKAIKNAISSLSASGSTAGEKGMQMAYEIAKDNFIEGGNNRVIMATDGDLNVGISDPDDLEKFIKTKKDDGIFLSVLGFGDGNYKDDKLERLADCGNGNYSYIDCKKEAHKVLVDEMSSTLVTVAKDVKFQVEFNPAKVNSYRLIGYENRQMDAVDFNNDKKDGGEIGSGHSVVALYEIVPVGADSAIDLKYQQVAGNDTSNEYATIKIRYKEPDEDVSKLVTYVADDSSYREEAGENLAFAGLVSEFAMLLSDSEYSGNITYADIMDDYKSLKYTDDYRDEFYNLVRMVEKRS